MCGQRQQTDHAGILFKGFVCGTLPHDLTFYIVRKDWTCFRDTCQIIFEDSRICDRRIPCRLAMREPLALLASGSSLLYKQLVASTAVTKLVVKRSRHLWGFLGRKALGV